VEGGFDETSRLLALSDRPTAIFAFNDQMAIGAIRAARSRGLRIPEDVSIVGFDDTYEAQFVTPALTTVRQPLTEMGQAAVSLLLRLLDSETPATNHLELATTLIVRDSTTPNTAR
jgi:LacI family transcriptional regulator